MAAAGRVTVVRTAIGDLQVETVGTGPPALLLHSLFVDSHQWQRVRRSLAAHRTLVLVDCPGHGRSGPPGALHARRLRRAAADVIAVLGLDAVDWVGNAWGGHVGLVFAARHPQLCRSLRGHRRTDHSASGIGTCQDPCARRPLPTDRTDRATRERRSRCSARPRDPPGVDEEAGHIARAAFVQANRRRHAPMHEQHDASTARHHRPPGPCDRARAASRRLRRQDVGPCGSVAVSPGTIRRYECADRRCRSPSSTRTTRAGRPPGARSLGPPALAATTAGFGCQIPGRDRWRRLEVASRSGRPAQSHVQGGQFRVQGLGQYDMPGVVRGDVLAELPHP